MRPCPAYMYATKCARHYEFLAEYYACFATSIPLFRVHKAGCTNTCTLMHRVFCTGACAIMIMTDQLLAGTCSHAGHPRCHRQALRCLAGADKAKGHKRFLAMCTVCMRMQLASTEWGTAVYASHDAAEQQCMRADCIAIMCAFC